VNPCAEEAKEQDGDGEQEEGADLAAAFDLPVCRAGWADWAGRSWRWAFDGWLLEIFRDGMETR
jgi:hypothetical protein